MADKFTPDQLKAVNSSEGNVLVSASAGSGKTFVMIKRLIRLVVEGKARVSEILAVTFTEAAAAEMKQKLIAALRKEFVAGKDNSKIRAALEEVPTASISTIHKFCADLLRRYFYEIGLDPAFRVADETVADDIRGKAVDKTFRKLYDEGNEDFLYLVRIFRSMRSDSALKETVKNIAEFASSEKDPEEFVLNCGKAPTEEEFFNAENAVAEYYKKKARDLRIKFKEVGERFMSLEIKGSEKYFNEILVKLDTMLAAKTLPLMAVAASVPVSKAPSVSDDFDDEKENFKDLKAKLKKLCDDIPAVLGGDEEFSKRVFLSTDRTVKALSDLTILYMREYAALKDEEALVDFSDLEHLAYKLLKTSPDALQSIRSTYKYAFCDEYQDVNAVQEAILSLVSPNNLFMVGDVKQCIYAFRGCDPDIFADKFASCGRETCGEAITLSENFRSTEGVLSAVNNVFSATMTMDFSRIDYANHPMVFGKLYPERTGKTVMHVITGKKEKSEAPEGMYDIVADALSPDETDSFYEGLLVGEIIDQELHKKIYDIKTGEERDVKPKDIAVLLRTTKGFATQIIKTLSRLSIPVTSAAKDPIAGYPEIRLLTDILHLIDFYADDAPLIAVLKSAVGGFSEEELAAIRSGTPQSSGVKDDGSKGATPTFAECVDYYLENGSDGKIARKLKKFDEYFKKIRLLSEFEGAGELLVRIIKDTSLDLDILSADLGEIRLERINRFIAESESGGEKLSVREFLKKLENAGDDLALTEAGGSDSVTVMSMHASKGLEFPVVIIAGIGRRFNAMDERDELLLSKTYGFAPYAYDEETMTKTSTIKRELVKTEKRQNVAREELRLLYVAMTRAQSRLHLISSAEIPPTRTETSAALAGRFIDYFSPADMEIVFHDKSEIEFIGGAGEEGRIIVGEPDPSLTERMLKNLGFGYPYEKDVTLPVKRSVTALTKEIDEGVVYGIEDVDEFDEEEDFIGQTDLKPHASDKRSSDEKRARGIAYHKFLENWDFNEKNVDNELMRQLSQGVLGEEQAELLNKNTLKRITKLKIFEELKGYELYREKQFIAGFKARDLGYADTDGEMLVQGVIDLLAVKGNEAIIVDYKDSGRSGEELLSAYRPQLVLYKKAVEKILNLKVTRAVLLSLRAGEAVDVE